MEELIPPDIYEQILVRLDVKTLIICKCVCKPWHSLISSPRFVKTSCNNDCTNNAIGRHRRVVIGRTDAPYTYYHLFGSCNGLVCIFKIPNEVLVANPSTREVKTLKSPKLPWAYTSPDLDVCWGFGYDSSTDDYKVIVGHLESSSHQICFQMLTLKSNVWIHIGKVNDKSIIYYHTIGTLCAGKLHWFVDYQDERWGTFRRSGILSFDLSTQKFKEIPKPHDFIYTSGNYRLGVIKECLCIFDYGYGIRPPSKIWVMNNDDVKQPWKLITAYDYAIEDQIVHSLDCLSNKISTDTDDVFLSKNGRYFNSPLFVRSLVSPYADGRPKRKRQTENTTLIKGLHSVPRLSARD